MRRRNVCGDAVFVPFLGREVGAGEVVEVPETQPDGSPIIWPELIWAPAEEE